MNIKLENRPQNKLQKYFFAAVCCMLFFSACNKADDYYEKLNSQPEVVRNLKVAYAVGDTLTLTGRLNPENDLVISVGNVKASYKVTQLPQNLDAAEIILTEEMGIGENRPIRLTSAGISIDVGNIEIVGNANNAILDRQLQLAKVADIPNGSIVIYYRGKNGNTYLWNAANKKLLKIAANGITSEVLDESKMIDEKGSFSIVEFNAGGISPDERYFYFSAKVKESGQSGNVELYKLVRYDLQSGQLNTLNRTEYPLLESQRTMDNAQPLEGEVKNVKIYKITGIFPDSKGNLYFNLIDHFLTKLDQSSQYSYALDFNNTDDTFIPKIFNPAYGSYYSASQIHQLLPGISASKFSTLFDLIDVETKVKYTKQLVQTLTLTDIETGFDTGIYPGHSFDSKTFTTPYVTASLNSFNGGLADNIGNPLPVDGKLIGLYFRNQISIGSATYDKFYNRFELPVLCEIDFENNRARRYAPKRLLLNRFNIRDGYQILNIDQQGMLYLTANGGTVIVKTAYIN